jgi:hypothetical protein
MWTSECEHTVNEPALPSPYPLPPLFIFQREAPLAAAEWWIRAEMQFSKLRVC